MKTQLRHKLTKIADADKLQPFSLSADKTRKLPANDKDKSQTMSGHFDR
ncbi:MAG: hypothetical protein JKY01_00010 [Pseudomonadales bacterium]|nr:hypothetical protein [Pseudomonadales bacterium]